MEEQQRFYVPPANLNNQPPSYPPPYSGGPSAPVYDKPNTDYYGSPYVNPAPYNANPAPYNANPNPAPYNANPYPAAYMQPQQEHHHHHHQPHSEGAEACAIITLLVTLAGCCFCPLCLVGCVAGFVGMKDKAQNSSSHTLFKVSAYLGGGCVVLYFVLIVLSTLLSTV